MNFKFLIFALLVLFCISAVNADDNITVVTDDLVKYYHNDTQFQCRLEGSSDDVSNRQVSFVINNVSYGRTTNDEGIAIFKINLNPGKYIINTKFQNQSVFNNVTVLSLIESCDLVKYYHNDSGFSVRVFDKQGNLDVNRSISFNINGVFYYRVTDDSGCAGLGINLNPGEYVITAYLDDFAVSNRVVVLSLIESSDLELYYMNGSRYSVRVFDKQGNLAIGKNVSFNINGVFYYRVTDGSGCAGLGINLNPGEYVITAYLDDFAVSNRVVVLSLIESSDLELYYMNGSRYSVRVFDRQGNLDVNRSISFNINGVFYYRVTDGFGCAGLGINLNPGEYIITAYLDDFAISNNILVISRLISSGDVRTTYGEDYVFNVTVLDGQGNAVENSEVTFNIGGILSKRVTDSDGMASLNINLNAGTYSISYWADEMGASNRIDVKNLITVTTYGWNSGADVTKNDLIKSNLPASDLIFKIVEAAKSGTPLVTIKGGDGKSVFMTAGIHGNELASQVASLRLINEFEENPVSGTVYIIPFVYPKATAANVRNYNGVNLNDLAATSGTISNNIIKLILQFKCSAYGDFHCTQPGGDPGANAILGSYSPTYESARMANAIAAMTGFSKLIYNRAGDPYYGAMEDTANIYGVPSVTCETLTPRGVIASGSIERSMEMMHAFLKYNSLI